MPPDFFQRAREILAQSPWVDIIRVLEVIAGLVIILSIVAIIVFHRKQKQIEAEFKIQKPE